MVRLLLTSTLKKPQFLRQRRMICRAQAKNMYERITKYLCLILKSGKITLMQRVSKMYLHHLTAEKSRLTYVQEIFISKAPCRHRFLLCTEVMAPLLAPFLVYSGFETGIQEHFFPFVTQLLFIHKNRDTNFGIHLLTIFNKHQLI